MKISDSTRAFGAPGIDPHWTSSAKDGIGTAYSSSSNLWFTLSHGIVNEIYFPTVDMPNTRDLQFLITDGETFCHEEKRDLHHEIEYPEQNVLLYRITNSERHGRYRLVKEVIGEPHSSVLVIHTRLEINDPALRGKLRLYALLAPHLKGVGTMNTAETHSIAGRKFIHAHREDIHLAFGCRPDFTRRSVGYVGASDGWQDLMANFKMDWEFERADNGNVAGMGEIDLSQGLEFTLGVAFAFSSQSASTKLLQAFGVPFASQRARYVAQWQRARTEHDWGPHTGDGASMARLSQCVLRAHEDKLFPGATVASLSIPWGETKGDSDRGGYHLVWTRDMVHTATAMLASGDLESPLRALIWLAAIQGEDGGLPQNSSISGEPYWTGIQLDEVASPILLAWRLRVANALREYDPWVVISRAAQFLIQQGPVTAQERWEENGGYSPSTLAAMIAALVCAAEFARENDAATAEFLVVYADWLAAHVEDWTVTTRGELVPGKTRHYIRITPANPQPGLVGAHPDTAEICLANGGGIHPARNIVSGDFLQLVRLGVREAHDPVVVDSLAVIDHVLKRELPQGPGWRRYNFDGYGQKPDGSAYDGTGEGRAWPLLTGERGHYELSAGRDPLPLIAALEKFSNHGGMLPEQVWDAGDLPEGRMVLGGPTGAAMPLCWAHAEYLSLVRSRKDGVCFDRPEPVYRRYGDGKARSDCEMWTLVHPLSEIPTGKTLRIIVSASVKVRWTCDDWVTSNDTEARSTAVGCWFADVPSKELTRGTSIIFTFGWKNHWEGRNFHVVVR